MKERNIAVAGVNDNPEKFGYKIFCDLLKDGYKVYAVGVRGGAVCGEKIYKTLADLPIKPDLVITVVPPSATDKITEDCIILGVKAIWMQPGSKSCHAVDKARAAGIDVTDSGCFMVVHGLW